MARTGVNITAGLQMDDEITNRDEHVLGDILLNRLVDPAQDFTWIKYAFGMGPKGTAAERCHQGAGHAFSGDVGDDQADVVIIRSKQVVVVAADLTGGDALRSQVQMLKIGQLLGQK